MVNILYTFMNKFLLDLQELVKLKKGIIYEEFQTKTEKIMEESIL